MRNKKKPLKVIHHANRYGQFDEAFLRYMAREVPAIKHESVSVQLALCSMIFEAPTRYRAHTHHEGHSRFTWQELEQSFGRNGFKAINDRLGLFEVLKNETGREDWNWKKEGDGRTKAFMLTEQVSTIRDKYLKGVLKRRPTNWLTEDGKYLQTLPANAMMAKNKDGQSRRGFHDLPVTALVAVNMVQIKKLIVSIQARLIAYEADIFLGQPGFVNGELFSEVPDTKFLNALKQEAAMMYSKANNKNWPGFVMHRYMEVQSGRVYVQGANNLGNCYGVLREVAMAGKGMYDIDIENCHYSILAQMAGALKYQCTAIQDYLDEKQKVRKSMAAEFRISEQQAKDALISLIYGAKFSARDKDALPKIFNGDTALADKIYLHPKFLALRNDIAGARNVVLDALPVSRQTIQNCRGLTMRLDESNERQRLAHLLQGVEVTALEAAYRLYPKEIVLLQHDGFASTCQLDTKRIEAAMKDATGYTLQVEQKLIQVNLDRAHNKHADDGVPLRVGGSIGRQVEELPVPEWNGGVDESLIFAC